MFRRAKIILLLPLLLSLWFPTLNAQDLSSCPALSDLNTPRVICTYGTFENPYLDTGIATNLHATAGGFVRMGRTTIDFNGYGASITYLYHIDTSQVHVLLIRELVDITCSSQDPPDSLAYSMMEIQDSNGVPLGGPCNSLRFTYYDNHGTTTASANNTITYTTPNRQYAFDVRPYHGQTIRLHFRGGKPDGSNTRCLTRFTFNCIRLSPLTTGYICNEASYRHIAPNGFIYQWHLPDNPDSTLGTTSTFIPHDTRIYHCRLRSYVSPDSGCVIATLSTPPVTLKTTTAAATVTPCDTFEVDTVCRVRYLLDERFSSTITTSAGDTTVIPNDTTISHFWTLDGIRLHDTVTIVTLPPGSHTFVLAYNSSPQCTKEIVRHVFINRVACRYYDSLYSTCPSVLDLESARVFCGYGQWSSTDSTELPGIDPDRHTLITTPGFDINTNNLLSLIPPGENASIRLGNQQSGKNFESITFLYKVDTLKASLLILRYAAVLENPQHNPGDQPKFTFSILDSAGVDLDPVCYSAVFVSNTNLGWYMAAHGVLWKDWTTVGVDLRPIHGQTISIRLSTHDCKLGAHYGYAYFTLGCASAEIASDFCNHTYSFTAPDGFNYSWYNSADPSTILSNTRDYTTTVPGRYTCRMDFLGAPAGSDCYNTLDIQTYERHAVADFTLDTLDTLLCQRRVRLVNRSTVVTEYTADSVIVVPATRWQYLIDGLPFGEDIDTLVAALSPGVHTLQLIATIEGSSCSDTLTRQVDIRSICQFDDTLHFCEEQYPVTFDSHGQHLTVYGDTTMVFTHGDTLIGLTVMTKERISLTVADTIVENQLPHTFHGVTVADVAGIDTSIFFPGNSPECDTLVHYTLTVYPNVFDTALLFLCPSEIPFAYSPGVTIGGDTTIRHTGQHGEDSTVAYHVFVLSDSDTAFADTILENQLPWSFLDSLFHAGSFAAATDTLHAEFRLVNEQGCDSLIHYTLHIHWDGDHCDTTLLFPTLVTPNGDGINDRFVIGGLLENNCFKFNDLVIYDRTGQLVYHVHNISRDTDWWDPAAHRAPDATYFYVFKAHGVTIHTMHQGVFEVLR